MKDQTATRLQALLGLALWDAGLAADWAWFACGSRITVPDRRSGTREVGEYTQHVQCRWRLLSPTGIVTG